MTTKDQSAQQLNEAIVLADVARVTGLAFTITSRRILESGIALAAQMVSGLTDSGFDVQDLLENLYHIAALLCKRLAACL